MAEGYAVTNNTKFAYREEVTEGTAPADSATGSEVLLRNDGIETTIEREMLDNEYLTGSISKAVPQVGRYAEGIGFVAPVFLRGSGTLGTLPDYAYLMKHVMGGLHEGTSGTVSASPSPTTTTFTAASDVGSIGALIGVEIGANIEFRRVTGLSSHAYTVWPPLSSAPSTGADVYIGDTHLLKSTSTDFKSGTGYFYFDNSWKALFSGCKGDFTITMETGNRATCDFTMQALSYAYSNDAIGYTYAPSFHAAPICLSVTYEEVLAGTQGSASAVGSVVFDSTYGTEMAVGDYLIIDTSGAGAWETKQIATVTSSGGTSVTLTHSNFSAVHVGGACYVRRLVCVPSLEITVEMEKFKEPCMRAASGSATQFMTKRSVNVNLGDPLFKSMWNMKAMENSISREIWAVLGTESGNRIAICIPKFYPSAVSLDLGDTMVKMPVEGMAGVTTANDELFISHL